MYLAESYFVRVFAVDQSGLSWVSTSDYDDRERCLNAAMKAAEPERAVIVYAEHKDGGGGTVIERIALFGPSAALVALGEFL